MQPHRHCQHSPDTPGDIKGFEAAAETTGVLPETAGGRRDDTAVVKGGRPVDTAVVEGFIGADPAAVKGMVADVVGTEDKGMFWDQAE